MKILVFVIQLWCMINDRATCQMCKQVSCFKEESMFVWTWVLELQSDCMLIEMLMLDTQVTCTSRRMKVSQITYIMLNCLYQVTGWYDV